MAICKKTYDNFCWICGKPADSREHKHKKTDLKRNFDNSKKSPDKVAYFSNPDVHIEIQSINSDRVKFDKIICKKCNGDFTQPFDKSYGIFIEYILQNYNKLLDDKRIDFEDIYGSSWKESKRNLFAYYLKHIGCRLADNNIFVSKNIIDYINNKTNELTDLLIRFEVDCFLWNILKKLKNDDIMYSNLYKGEMNYIPGKSMDCIDTLYTNYTNEWFKIHFIYSENLNERLRWMGDYHLTSKIPINIENLHHDYSFLYEMSFDELLEMTIKTEKKEFNLKKEIEAKTQNPFNIT